MYGTELLIVGLTILVWLGIFGTFDIIITYFAKEYTDNGPLSKILIFLSITLIAYLMLIMSGHLKALIVLDNHEHVTQGLAIDPIMGHMGGHH